MQAAQLDAVTTAPEELLWQTFFVKILLAPKDTSALTNLFKSLAAPHLQKFAAAMAAYLKETFETSFIAEGNRERLAQRCKLAQQYLRNLKRIL